VSGPKGYQILLERQAREAREIAALTTRCASLRAQCGETESVLVRMGGTAPADARPEELAGDLDSWTAAEQALRARLDLLREDLRHVRRRQVQAHLAEAFGRLADGVVVTDGEEAERSEAPTTESRAAAQVRGSLARCLDRLADLDETRRPAMIGLADDARRLLEAGDVVAAGNVVLTLQTRSEHTLREQRLRERVAREAEDLAQRTADIVSAAADELRARAAACRTLEELEPVRELEQELRRQHERSLDHAYVVAQTRRALAGLGYEVGEDFTAAALDGREAVVLRPDLPDHGVDFRFFPSSGRVLTRVVSLAETSRARDEEVEVATCHDLDRLQELWQEEGIDSVRFHHDEPGTVAVERRARQTAGSRRSQTERGR
jgi:hypothetical protein